MVNSFCSSPIPGHYSLTTVTFLSSVCSSTRLHNARSMVTTYRPVNFAILLLAAAIYLAVAPTPAQGQVPAGMSLWLDASDLPISQAISTWPDKSEFMHSVTQFDGAKQPVAVQDANGVRSVQLLWGQYFDAPSIFPTLADYTIVVVQRLRDTASVHNMLSGDNRAYWFENNRYPAAAHDGRFHQRSTSVVPVRDGFNILTLQYSEATGQAFHHINGLFGDSLWIDSNHDSTLYIGSYARAYFTNSDIAEVLLYPRLLLKDERESLESALFEKYNLVRPDPLPKPDSTFTEIPRSLQLYPRGDDDSATVPISGSIYRTEYTHLFAEMYKNGSLLESREVALNFVKASEGRPSSAPFNIAFRIHAELSEHAFRIGLRNDTSELILREVDSVVCGDVIVTGGTSNSTFGSWTWKNENEYARTFGLNLSYNPRDTAWAVAEVNPWGLGASVGAWAATIQKLIAERHQIPTCIISWGAAGTILKHHLKEGDQIYDLSSMYSRLLYRLDKASLRTAVRAMYFWHGELDNFEGYDTGLLELFNDLRSDLPALQKIYLLQLRPSGCANIGTQNLRDFQRRVPSILPFVETIATTALPRYDGCHFSDSGWIDVGNELYRPLARDFYGRADTMILRSPSIKKAYYTSDTNDEIALEFDPPYELLVMPDETVGDKQVSVKDYIYLDSIPGKVKEILVVNGGLRLRLHEAYKASKISYGPDKYIHETEFIYTTPWIVAKDGPGVLLFHDFAITSKSSVANGDTRVLLYPNPADSRLLLQIPARSDKAFVRLVDITGRYVMDQVHELVADQESLVLNVGDLPAGAYSIRLTIQGRHWHNALVVY